MLSKKPKLLVLDGQGVVFDAPIKRFLRLFARSNGVDCVEVASRWEHQLRYLAWTGAIDDESLWTALAGKKVSVEETMCSLSASYRPGPVAEYLGLWSQLVPIWLLSNHRSHWVLPQLDLLNLTDAFQRLLISDTTGVVKPDTSAFGQLFSGEIAAGDILFVDDQEHNVRAAERLGLETLHAFPGYEWVDAIDSILQGCGRSPVYFSRASVPTNF